MSHQESVLISPPDPSWPAKFAEERQRLLADFRSEFVEIEHFGSTAIHGLAAKPVIDMLGGVRSIEAADRLLGPLCLKGWETSPEFSATLSDRRFLRRRHQNDIRTHHLHLVVYQGEQWRKRLAFRDYLRNHPDILGEYEALKLRLADIHRNDREAYTDAKKEFVEKILSLALCK